MKRIDKLRTMPTIEVAKIIFANDMLFEKICVKRCEDGKCPYDESDVAEDRIDEKVCHRCFEAYLNEEDEQ